MPLSGPRDYIVVWFCSMTSVFVVLSMCGLSREATWSTLGLLVALALSLCLWGDPLSPSAVNAKYVCMGAFVGAFVEAISVCR